MLFSVRVKTMITQKSAKTVRTCFLVKGHSQIIPEIMLKKSKKAVNEKFPKITHYFHPNVGLNSLAMLFFYFDYYYFSATPDFLWVARCSIFCFVCSVL